MSWTAPFRPLLRAGETVIDRLLCVVGAVAFAQLPEFIQQYRQRLGGQLDEARRQISNFESVAAHAKLTLPQFIDHTSANSDVSVSRLGALMHDTLQRFESLNAAEIALRDATLWGKPFVFFTQLDPALAHATLSIYRPAVPTTLEGLIYAAAGMLVLLGCYHGLIRYPIMAAIERRRHERLKRRGTALHPTTTSKP